MPDRRHAHAEAPTPRVGRRRRVMMVLLGGLAVIVVLFAYVYPTRTYMQQRKEIDAAELRLEVLRESSRSLARENERLETDAEVERRAREDFGLVRPGETPYVLVPAPASAVLP